MAFRLTRTIVLGTAYAGLTLKAQLVDPTGANVGSAVATGFVDLGGGNYIWDYNAFPDGFRGVIKYLDNGTSALYAVEAINPEELNSSVGINAGLLADGVLRRCVDGGVDDVHTVGEALALLRNSRSRVGNLVNVYDKDGNFLYSLTIGAEAVNPITQVTAP